MDLAGALEGAEEAGAKVPLVVFGHMHEQLFYAGGWDWGAACALWANVCVAKCEVGYVQLVAWVGLWRCGFEATAEAGGGHCVVVVFVCYCVVYSVELHCYSLLCVTVLRGALQCIVDV